MSSSNYLEIVKYDKEQDLDFNRVGYPVSLETKFLYAIFGTKVNKYQQNMNYPFQKNIVNIFGSGGDDDNHFNFDDFMNIVYLNNFKTLNNMNSKKLEDLSLKLKMLYVKLNEEQVKSVGE